MKKILLPLICIMLVFTLTAPCFAIVQTEGEAVVDTAQLLTDSQESRLSDRISSIKSTYSYDIVIHTAQSTQGASVVDYADDFFDYNGYGLGENRDGMAFVLIMDTRDYYTSTSGLGVDIFNDAVIDYLGNSIVGYLSDGEYYEAFDKYLDEVDQYLYEYSNGDIVGAEYGDEGSASAESLRSERRRGILVRELAVIVVAFIVAFIAVGVMKSKMNTAIKKTRAGEYMKNGSLDVSYKRDTFLYDTVTKVAKPQSENNSRPSGGGGSSGGSSVHTSSSGSSHGGGGGKF